MTDCDEDSYIGGILGWCGEGFNVTMDNCLFAGTYSGSYRFHPIGFAGCDEDRITKKISRTYYITDPSADAASLDQGTKVYAGLQPGINKLIRYKTLDLYYTAKTQISGNLIYTYTGKPVSPEYTVSFDGAVPGDGGGERRGADI